MSEALRQAIERQFAGQRGDAAIAPAIPGLTLMRATGAVLPPKHRLYRPALCIVAQGAKEVAFSDRVLRYAEGQALVVSLELPAFGRVTEASPERPYLSINLDLDPALIAEMLGEVTAQQQAAGRSPLGLFVADVDGPFADSLERLLRLLDTPAAIPVLSRQALREIYYWLLTGPHGAAIARLTTPEGHAQRIARALRLLRQNFAQPVRVEALAAAAGMSVSSFHQHFKALTALSPLQYQKQLRLIEARRLLSAEEVSATGAV